MLVCECYSTVTSLGGTLLLSGANLHMLNSRSSCRCEGMTTRPRPFQPKSCWCSLPTDLFERLLSILPDNVRCVDPVPLLHTRGRAHVTLLCATRALKPGQIRHILAALLPVLGIWELSSFHSFPKAQFCACSWRQKNLWTAIVSALKSVIHHLFL